MEFERPAERAAALAFKINAAAKENDLRRAATHALELVKINAAAKVSFARNATSVLIACLALAVVTFLSREAAALVE